MDEIQVEAPKNQVGTGGNYLLESQLISRPSINTDTPNNNLQHPNPDFIRATLEAFPDAGVATVEEALVLYLEGGYKFLDVRSDRERDFGAIKNSIHVPYTKDKKEFLEGGMKITKTRMDKEAWLKAVNSKILKKDTKLIVHDMIGKTYGLECLELLFENGYENIVGLKGGFKPWFKTFDFNLRRQVMLICDDSLFSDTFYLQEELWRVPGKLCWS
jgi:rhodanese-related sulfurtransferase